MKKSNLIFITILIIVSLIFTAVISKIVPKDKFDPYILKLDSVWEKTNEQQEYLIDINHDQVLEKIVHHNINIPGHSIEFHIGENIHQVHIFRNGEKFIGKYLKFADIDNDSTQELLFVSAQNHLAYLNIYSYNANTKEFLLKEKVKIDTIKKFNDKTDVINNFIVTNGNEIFLDLQGSYSIQPRKIYEYNYKNKQFLKTRLSSLVTPKVQYFNYQNRNYLLATYVKAIGNTLSPKEAETLRNSTNKDTIAIYESLKHLEYEYGDFSSYILLYNDSLNFAFKPIEFFGWTNFTKSALIYINNIPHIVSFTNAQMNEPDNQKCKLVTICNLQGKIIKQISLPHNYSDIFSVNNNIIFYGENTLFITNENLVPKNEISNISFAHGFQNIDNDNKPEFIAFSKNTLRIYSSDFKLNASYKIEQEFSPYPEENSFASLKTDNKNSFVFNTRLFYYKFSYNKNNIAFLKYPFYITVFLVIFGILYLIFRLNSKRLEKENLKLEQIITDRTKEIVSQKEEIQTQANELKIKNHNLIELIDFKKLMTGTIIHDLKNPLNSIINLSKNKKVVQPAYTMLNLVQNILDVQKYEENKIVLHFENIYLSKIVELATKRVKLLLTEKNIKIEIIFENDFLLRVDKELVIRIFENLLTNAIKFSPLNQTIKIIAENNTAQSVLIKIIDNGKGISKDKLERVFEKFQQIEKQTSGSTKSTGLGLTFCKMAVEAHKGKIWAESEENSGATFLFTLPNTSKKGKVAKATKIQEKFKFTEQENLILAEIIKKLKNIPVFELSSILAIIEKDTENVNSKAINEWKNDIKTTIYSANNELYQKLLNETI